MQIKACSEVSEFLSFLKRGTRNVYGRGLEAFQEFYSSQGSIKDFLDSIENDRLLPRIQRKRVDRLTLNGFVDWLQERGYSPKTIRIYVGAVQSLAKYFDIPLAYVMCNCLQPSQSIRSIHGLLKK